MEVSRGDNKRGKDSKDTRILVVLVKTGSLETTHKLFVGTKKEVVKSQSDTFSAICCSINGHYLNDVDRSLNETVVDKIRAYRPDYNNRPSNSISFMTTIVSTSGRLHSEVDSSTSAGRRSFHSSNPKWVTSSVSL